MARLPFPDYNSQRYYVSRSFAVSPAHGASAHNRTIADSSECKQEGSVFTYPANASPSDPHALGMSCTEAKSKFLSGNKTVAQTQAIVPATPTHSGEISDTKTQLSELHNQYMNSPVGAKLGLPDPSKLFSGGSGGSSGGGGGSGGGPCDKDPATGCCNCGSDWYNPAQWACQIQKAVCEFSTVAGKGLGDFGQYLPYIAIGGAAILLIVFIKK